MKALIIIFGIIILAMVVMLITFHQKKETGGLLERLKAFIDRYGVIVLLCIFAVTILAALIASIILAAGGRWWQILIGALGIFGALVVEAIVVIGIINEIKGGKS